MTNKNFMEVEFSSDSINEGFARGCVAAFCLQLNPSLDEISDIKTVVSEAVTNCVVHAYPKNRGTIKVRCEIEGRKIKIQISDGGVGIKDISAAKQPFFTTRASEERSGMGFTIMESFMDKMEVESNKAGGTVVTLYKELKANAKVAEGE